MRKLVISAELQEKFNNRTEWEALIAGREDFESIGIICSHGTGATAQLVLDKLEVGQNYIISGSIRFEKLERESGAYDLNLFLDYCKFQPCSRETRMNEVYAIGRWSRDMEVMHYESGSVKASNSMAVNINREQAVWLNVELWGRSAETADKYTFKGSNVGIEGRLQIQRWTDKTTGSGRFKYVVAADQLDLVGKKGDDTNQSQEDEFSGYGQQKQQKSTTVRSSAQAPEEDYADIPF